ncbi:MAG: twin-arginine translocation signal domain-containing protein [Anaerolineae bacterium]
MGGSTLSRRGFLQRSALAMAAALLASCAPKQATAPTAAPAQAEATKVVATAAVPAPAEMPTIEWLGLTYDDPQGAMDKYTEETGVPVRAEALGWNDFFEQVMVRLAAATGQAGRVLRGCADGHAIRLARVAAAPGRSLHRYGTR